MGEAVGRTGAEASLCGFSGAATYIVCISIPFVKEFLSDCHSDRHYCMKFGNLDKSPKNKVKIFCSLTPRKWPLLTFLYIIF